MPRQQWLTPSRLAQLEKDGRVRTRSRSNGKTIVDQLAERYGIKQDDDKKPHKYGAKPVKATDPRNAHGIDFPSTIEFLMYDALVLHQIPFIFQRQFKNLIPAMDYAGKKYPAMNGKIDFWLPDHQILLDTKGKVTTGFRYRARLMMKQLSESPECFEQGPPPVLLCKWGQLPGFIQMLKQHDHWKAIPCELLKIYLF